MCTKQKEITNFFNENSLATEKQNGDRQAIKRRAKGDETCDRTSSGKYSECEVDLEEEHYDDAFVDPTIENAKHLETVNVDKPTSADMSNPEAPITQGWMISYMDKLMKTIDHKMEDSIDRAVTKALEKSNVRLSNLERENSKLKDDVLNLTTKLDKIVLDVNHNAQYSRKNTVRFLGIPEKESKAERDNEKCEESICEAISAYMPGVITPDDIEISHRLRPYKQDDRYPRSVIAKLKWRTGKDAILSNRKKLKGSNIIVYEDLSPMNRKLLQDVKEHPEVEQQWSKNGKIFGKLMNGDKVLFNICSDVNDTIIEHRLSSASAPTTNTSRQQPSAPRGGHTGGRRS